ncbi:hypothetical protein Dimus_004892 [Dionaea muscipula]
MVRSVNRECVHAMFCPLLCVQCAITRSLERASIQILIFVVVRSTHTRVVGLQIFDIAHLMFLFLFLIIRIHGQKSLDVGFEVVHPVVQLVQDFLVHSTLLQQHCWPCEGALSGGVFWECEILLAAGFIHKTWQSRRNRNISRNKTLIF